MPTNRTETLIRTQDQNWKRKPLPQETIISAEEVDYFLESFQADRNHFQSQSAEGERISGQVLEELLQRCDSQLLERNKQLDEQIDELTQTNARLQDTQRRLQRLVQKYTHTLGNTLFPETIYRIAQKLKEQPQFNREYLLLYEAYHAEVSILQQSELLQLRHVTNDPEGLRSLLYPERLSADSTEPAVTIKQILNDALERVTARFLNEHYAKLRIVRERVLNQLHLSLSVLQQDFETQVLFAEIDALTWVSQNLLPIHWVEFSDRWQHVNLKKGGYAEALLYSYFDELLLNVFKYSDYQLLTLRGYEQQIGGIPYLRFSCENTYVDNASNGTNKGLEGIREDLRILNDSTEEVTTLEILTDKVLGVFKVTLSLRKELLSFELPEYEYEILQ
jgi:hypothetical protein